MNIRRYLLIWLGLFLPTVGIGIIAIGLLVREQARLNALEERSNMAQAQTVADNADLIMAEIKTGVSQALEAASGEGNEAARLSELTKSNPFVSTTYIWNPTHNGDFTDTFASQSQTLSRHLLDLSTPPWGKAQPKPELITQELIVQKKSSYDSTSNYSNAQSQRYNIREFAQQNAQILNDLKINEAYADNTEQLDSEIPQIVAPPLNSIAGWLTSTSGSPQWLAWYQRETDGRVTGALLDTATVLAQLEQAFPYVATGHITYRIETPDQAAHSDTSLTNAQRIPLGTELPNWQLAYSTAATASNHSIPLVGGLLVAILCTTSLGAGTLILWRARKDARDSAQKSTFVSNVSHELRTPLTTIRMYAEMLEDGRIIDEAKQLRYLGTITSESQRLTRLVDNVLDFSHLDQGRKRYKLSQVDLIALIDTVLKSQEARLLEHPIQVDWTPPATTPQLKSDSDALEQVILNLIDNAIKYAGSGQSLQIQLSETPAHIELQIADNGPGIASRDREKIFKAFQRLDESLTSEQPGSGLGLSICRGILRDLGGDITLRTQQSQGCCFVIQLPHTAKPLSK